MVGILEAIGQHPINGPLLWLFGILFLLFIAILGTSEYHRMKWESVEYEKGETVIDPLGGVGIVVDVETKGRLVISDPSGKIFRRGPRNLERIDVCGYHDPEKYMYSTEDGKLFCPWCEVGRD